jgi:putative peptide zinc metalloprotease protein
MLCPACRVHQRRDFPYCLHCGTPRRKVHLDKFVAPLLVPLDGAVPEPVPLTHAETSLGRAADSDVVLDDPSVSRAHARIVRRGDRFVIEDRDSLNGVVVDGVELRGGVADLTDGATIELGDVSFRFDQPRPIAVGGRTIYGTSHTVLRAAPAPGAPEATEPLSVRPRKRSGWALKQAPDATDVWLLSSRSGNYLRIDERDLFVFHSIDGESTVRDLLLRYADEYGELALPRIENLLRSLAAVGVVDLGRPDPATVPAWRRLSSAIYRALLRLEISVSGIDGLMGRLYQRLGWRAFTRTGTALVLATMVAGLWAFTGAQRRERLFAAGGSGWWGALVVAGAYCLALTVHETAHALAVKSYGRKVRRGGFMITMGMPFAFVDTSDMWFGTRWSRVVVSMSGPVSTAALAGVAALGARWLPGPVAPALCFQIAYGLYMNTAYNFNPVMPLDGYQALTDAFRIPRLREEAREYFLHGIWTDLRARRRPRLRQLGLLLYGLAAVVGGYVFVLLGLIAWRHRIGPFVHHHVPAPWDVIVLLAGIVLLTFPIWVRLARWLHRLAGGMQRRAGSPTGLEPVTEAHPA